jgi:nicotinamidase-related amidase
MIDSIHTTPTQSGATSPNPDLQRVLLLLDVQQAMLEPPPIGVPASSQVHDNLSQILSYARRAASTSSSTPFSPSSRPLIIHVRNNGDSGELDDPSTPGWQLIFPPIPGEIVIDKRKNNAFAGTNLADFIPPHAEIVVAGFQTDYSIRATCSAALGRGNEVLLIRGAHATYDRIEVLHGGGITPASKIEEEIEAELEEAGVHLLDMKDVDGVFENR